MKDTFYFQHDYNARNDPKLQDVLIDLGVEGIGVFWCIIEQLYEQGGKLPLRSCKSIAFASVSYTHLTLPTNREV